MPLQFDEARPAVRRAREAMSNNDRTQARQWPEEASRLAPQMEDPWLILAAIANPHDSLEYIQHALEINPKSPRAQRGLEWATQRLHEPEQTPKETAVGLAIPSPAGNSNPSKGKRSLLLPILIVSVGCLLIAAAGFSALLAPNLASIFNQSTIASAPTQSQSWAQVSIPKPTYTLAAPPQQAAALNVAATPADPPTEVPTPLPTEPPSETVSAAPTNI